jgi:TetR/AcrR family transcriptional regulator, ethionamide resistance regulator
MAKGSVTRRRPQSSRGDAREAALLEVAERLLEDGRFDATSIAEIAAAADISRSAFYFYFASKQALLERLIEATLDELIDRRLSGLDHAGGDPAERLLAFLHGVAQMWVEHAVVLSAAAELAGSVPALFERIAGVVATGVDAVARIMVESDAATEIDDPAEARELAAALLWMGERSFYVLARSAPEPEEFHALAERLFVIWARTAGLARPSGMRGASERS